MKHLDPCCLTTLIKSKYLEVLLGISGSSVSAGTGINGGNGMFLFLFFFIAFLEDRECVEKLGRMKMDLNLIASGKASWSVNTIL